MKEIVRLLEIGTIEAQSEAAQILFTMWKSLCFGWGGSASTFKTFSKINDRNWRMAILRLESSADPDAFIRLADEFMRPLDEASQISITASPPQS